MDKDQQEPEVIINYRLALTTNRSTFFFLPKQIVRMEASSNYTRIYFANHLPLTSSRILKDYEEILEPYGFVRTHRSHLVNKDFITRIENRLCIIMHDTSKVKISRRKRRHVMNALTEKMVVVP
jgi:two-component system LytT family response regulator